MIILEWTQLYDPDFIRYVIFEQKELCLMIRYNGKIVKPNDKINIERYLEDNDWKVCENPEDVRSLLL